MFHHQEKLNNHANLDQFDKYVFNLTSTLTISKNGKFPSQSKPNPKSKQHLNGIVQETKT